MTATASDQNTRGTRLRLLEPHAVGRGRRNPASEVLPRAPPSATPDAEGIWREIPGYRPEALLLHPCHTHVERGAPDKSSL